MQSSHRTGATTWRTNAARMAAGSLTAAPVVLVKTVNRGRANSTVSRNVAKAARAGSISRLW